MNKNSKNKIIYGYVRCETKHCANNFKILKVPKTLVGKQICQICKNVMFKVNVDKNLEVIENKKTKNKKKIDHFFKNLNINKLLNVLNNWKPELVYDLADKITECVKGYNDFNDEGEYFRSYLAPLIYTGELFKKLKLHFKITNCYSCIMYEDTLWNEAYVLYCNKDKKYRLINTEFRSNMHDAVHILDTITENKYKKISNKNNYYMKLLDEYVEKEYDYMFKDKNVDDDFFKSKNPPYYKPTKSLILPASYYKSYHREALHLEHVEKDTIEVAEGYSGKYLLGKKNGYGTIKYKSGDIYKGEFKMDLFNGVGEYTWANGLIYNGDWKDGKKNGKGTLTHPSGEKYSGDFKDDKKHGKGYYINPNGMNYEGSYKNDIFHGKGKFIDATGKVIEGTFKEGKLIK
tara:strand:+ start:1032 stop:2240 length:1209 start_codon:yes stop_codon:yes gene_type:complete